MNKKLANLKNRTKNTIKEHAPELITFGASVIALVAYASYVMKSTESETGHRALIVDDSVEIFDSEDGCIIMPTETLKRLNEIGTSIRFDYDEDNSYRFSKINPED